MIDPGDPTVVVQRLVEDPAILGLGDLDLQRSGCRFRQASLLFEARAESVLYVVELQLGPADDRQVIRVVEGWAAVRKRRGRRCIAVLVAERIEPRYASILAAIATAVPIVVLEMHFGDGTARFAPVVLR